MNPKLSDRAAILAVCLLSFAVTMWLRLMGAHESLWVDELHTSWVVSGPWDTVSQRAAAGNQSPLYFQLLWGWCRVFGHSEWALRFPSIIAISLWASVATGAVASATRKRIPAIVIGLMIALDRNAIFFGGEARGYAWIVLVVGVFAWLLCDRGRLCDRRLERGNERHWFHQSEFPTAVCVCVCALIAVMLHITAGLAVMAIVGVTWLARPRQFVLPISATIGVALGVLANWPVISSVWTRRGQWEAFGGTESVAELWSMWPWVWWVLLPWGWSWLAKSTPRDEAESTNVQRASMACASFGLLGAVVVGTGFAWSIAWFDIAAIWHRRFLIGLMAPLTLAAGYRWGLARGGWWLLVLPLAMAWQEGTLPQIWRGERVLTPRGEQWREAVDYVNTHLQPEDRVMLAAQLLESSWLDPAIIAERGQPTEDELRYLAYPLSGAYQVPGVELVGRLEAPDSAARLSANILGGWETAEGWPAGTVWILVRRRSSLLGEWLDQLESELEERGWQGSTTVRSLGRVALVQIESNGQQQSTQ